MYFHGGGFVFCDLESHDGFCRALARHVDAVRQSMGGDPHGRRIGYPRARANRRPAMSGDPVKFLNTFAQALAAMALYRDGHPARERAVDVAYQQLSDLQTDTPRPLFTFLGDEVVFGRLPLRDLKAWDWSKRLAEAGIQRLEFEDRVGREDFEGFLEEVLARLTLSAVSTEARQMRQSSIRFGAVGLKGEPEIGAKSLPTATISFSLGEELDPVRRAVLLDTRPGRRQHLVRAAAPFGIEHLPHVLHDGDVHACEEVAAWGWWRVSGEG